MHLHLPKRSQSCSRQPNHHSNSEEIWLSSNAYELISLLLKQICFQCVCLGWAEGPTSFYVNVSSAPLVAGRVTAESFLVSIPESKQTIKQTAGVTWIYIEPAKARVRTTQSVIAMRPSC